MSHSRHSKDYYKDSEYYEQRSALVRKKRHRYNRRMERERIKRRRRVVSEYGPIAIGPCGRKMRYRTKQEALNKAKSSPAAKLTAYRCPYCKGWHLTSHPKCEGDTTSSV